MATEFGALPDGRPVLRATISGHGLTVSVITLGASVQDMRLDGIDHPLVLGFATLDPYLGEGRYMGAIVGRYANRIGHGRAVLDGQALDLDRNQGGRHTLHGGADGTGKPLSCTNATLRQIAERRPRSLADLERLQGMDAQKAERFGPAFLAILGGEEA